MSKATSETRPRPPASPAPAARRPAPGPPPTPGQPATSARGRCRRSFYTDPAWYQQELERIHLDMWLYAGRADRIASPASVFPVPDRRRRGAGPARRAGPGPRLPQRLPPPGHPPVPRGPGAAPGPDPLPLPRLDLPPRRHPGPGPPHGEGARLRPRTTTRWARSRWRAGRATSSSTCRRGPLPFAEHLAGLDVRFANYAMDELRAVERRRYQLHANWKLIIQNYHECLHCPTAHPQLNRLSHYLSGDNEPPQPTYLGSRMDLREGITTLSSSEQPRRDPLAPPRRRASGGASTTTPSCPTC